MKILYRPEIDGLRGVAVISVILYHAQITISGINFFKGGYLGVDIFFVISGYLITSIIYKEIKVTKKFSFKNFYERRIRRILPILFLISLVTTILCFIFLLPTDLVNTSKSILLSTGFASNFYFYFSGLEYGGLDSNFKPFLHTWSLSVEEQYYLIFPIFFVAVINFSKNYLFNSIILIFLCSLFFSHYGAINHPNATFYFLHTRIWEILAGALLVFPKIDNNFPKKNLRLNNFILLISFFLILASIYFFDDYSTHPAFFTLIPVLSTCLIILYSNRSSLITKLLSNKLLVNVGLISYSLYLWHHPIFSIIRYSAYDLNYVEKILLVLFIIVISFLTYKFIENPFRNKKIISIRKLKIYLISSFIIIIFLNITIIYNKGFSDRFYNTETFSLDNQNYKNKKEEKYFKIELNNDFKDKEKNILIIGDSHGADTYLIFDEAYKNNNKNIGVSHIWTELYCLKDLKYKKLCESKLTPIQNEMIKAADLVVLSTSWIQKDVNGLEQIINYLKKIDKKIVIMDKSPFFKWYNFFSDLDLYVLRNDKLPNSKELNLLEKKNYLSMLRLSPGLDEGFFDEESQKINVGIINDELQKIAKKNNLLIFSKINYICDEIKLKCEMLDKSKQKLFYDNSHYTLDGISYFIKKITKFGWFKSIENIL